MRKALVFSVAMLPVFACGGGGGGGDPTVPTSSATTVTASSASATPPGPAGETAYGFVMGVTGCWLGGMWAEAEGEQGEKERRAAVEIRCKDVVKIMTGAEDATKFNQLRAIDPAITKEVDAKVVAFAKEDKLDAAKGEGLAKLTTAISLAAREALLARKASEAIKAEIDKLKTDKDKDAARNKDADKLSADEVKTIPALKATAALEALMNVSGDYAHDAKGVALLLAISRVEHARGMPKHMKLYAVGGSYKLAFGAALPAVGDDANAKLKPGTWLAYVSDVAKAAGHPVPDTAKTPTEKEPFAWSGVLQGFADKLKVEQPSTKGELQNVIGSTVGRLESKSQMAADKGAAPVVNPPPKK